MSFDYVTLSRKKSICVHLEPPPDRLMHPTMFLSLESPEKYLPTATMKCQNCDHLQKMIDIKDVAIHKLSEDRDELKYKLTAAVNKNIELSQQMKRLSSELNQPQKTLLSQDFRFESRSDEAGLKQRCAHLEAVNQHLQQHLTTLRNVFKQFEMSTSSGTNETRTTNTTTSTTEDVSTAVNVTSSTIAGTSEFETSFDRWYRRH